MNPQFLNKSLMVLFSVKLLLDTLIIVGLLGFFYTVKVLLNLKKFPTKTHHWWISFQLFCVLYQIYFMTEIFKIFNGSNEIFKAKMVLYTLLDVSVLCSILVSFSIKNSPEVITTLDQQMSDLSPPSYEEATKNIVRKLWFIKIFI